MLAFNALATTGNPHAHRWHEGCLCELKANAASSDLAMPSIFGTSFFRQSGRVSQFCPCSIETVQRLNSELIMPRLLPLLNRTFFRYAKLNLDRPCPFWDDGYGSCALRDCGVEMCSEDEERRLAQCSEEQALGVIERVDVAQLGAAAPSWDLTSSWTADLADADEPGQYIDLVDNPEQYTGYSPASGASRVWEEWHGHNNLFPPSGCAAAAVAGGGAVEAMMDRPGDVPVEMRLFNRLTSGIHASVSSHIAANYLLDRKSNTWGLEIDEYERRLGARPERLNNLHFTYLTVLRALELAAAHLSEAFAFSTGMPREDALVARSVRELLSTHPEWPYAAPRPPCPARLSRAPPPRSSPRPCRRMPSGGSAQADVRRAAGLRRRALPLDARATVCRAHLRRRRGDDAHRAARRAALAAAQRLAADGLRGVRPLPPVGQAAGAGPRHRAAHPVRARPAGRAALAAALSRRGALQSARPPRALGRGGARRGAAPGRGARDVLAARLQGLRVRGAGRRRGRRRGGLTRGRLRSDHATVRRVTLTYARSEMIQHTVSVVVSVASTRTCYRTCAVV